MSQPSLAATEDEAFELDDEEATEDEELQQSLEGGLRSPEEGQGQCQEALQDIPREQEAGPRDPQKQAAGGSVAPWSLSTFGLSAHGPSYVPI